MMLIIADADIADNVHDDDVDDDIADDATIAGNENVKGDKSGSV